MGRRGPPRKPTKLKKAQGTYQKCRDLDASEALVLPPGAPAMPDHLPAQARRMWCELVPQLLEAGTLAKVDGGALEAYCRSYAHWLDLDDEAMTRPLVKTPFGPKINPAGDEARKLMKDVLLPRMYALVL